MGFLHYLRDNWTSFPIIPNVYKLNCYFWKYKKKKWCLFLIIFFIFYKLFCPMFQNKSDRHKVPFVVMRQCHLCIKLMYEMETLHVMWSSKMSWNSWRKNKNLICFIFKAIFCWKPYQNWAPRSRCYYLLHLNINTSKFLFAWTHHMRVTSCYHIGDLNGYNVN